LERSSKTRSGRLQLYCPGPSGINNLALGLPVDANPA
jgi:hypothetical protein